MSQTLRLSLRRVVAFMFALVASGATARAQFPTTRQSLDSSGNQGNGASGIFGTPGAVSLDGSQIAFTSLASNLVSGDTNGREDVFVRDVVAGKTVRVSVDSSGAQANADCLWPSISSDGRFVTFASTADNLVAGDTNKTYDIFRVDRDPDGNGIFDEGNSVTIRVDVDSSGAQANYGSSNARISGNGNVVAFDSWSTNLVPNDTNGAYDVFLHDCTTGVTTSITLQGNGNSYWPWISSKGNAVAFTSVASNLVSGDTNNGEDVFVCDLATLAITRVSVDSSGNQASGRGPSPLSDDGSIVAFTSDSNNLVSGDTNARSDVFVHDANTGVTTRESVSTGGGQYGDYSDNPSISGDGNIVTFMRHDLKLGSEGWYQADFRPYARNRSADVTLPLNVNCGGQSADGDGMYPTVSADGRYVGFTSYADDLVTGDTNATADLFVYDLTISEPNASWSNYGAGFPGTLGVPTLTMSADPVLGTTTTLDVGSSTSTTTAGFLLIGLSSASISTSRGGTILVQWFVIDPVSIAPGGLSIPATLPLEPAWAGASVFVQAIELDAGAQFGLSFTAGLQATFGR